jgi:predicted TIM-barrel fold metal-dependent hydrolase
MEQQLKKYYAEAGFVGIKIHPVFHRYRVDGENYKLAWEFAQDHNLFILAHSWSGIDPLGRSQGAPGSPELFLKFIENYPTVSVILAHAGGTFEGVKQATQMAIHYENVYLDICGWRYSFTWIHEIVNQAGEQKIIYGSDFPWYDFESSLGRICLADISQSAKEKILGFNIKKIAKI